MTVPPEESMTLWKLPTIAPVFHSSPLVLEGLRFPRNTLNVEKCINVRGQLKTVWEEQLKMFP